MEIKDKLDLNQNGTLIDATKYHSMISALMYLTCSRPDIVHATCLCARYQDKPTEKHLKKGELFSISGKHNVSQTISQDTLIDFYIKLFYGSAWQYIKDRPTVDSKGVIRQLRAFRVILFSIYSDEWKSFQSQHQTALRGTNTLSWKPCNGGSVDGVTTSFQRSQNSRPPCSIIKDKYMMKAQVHVSKSFAISDEQPLP
nr:retrovirus-related Pol polyprotein from transposon TNT 1-94 [Tanacetum cinerariifolium]